MFVIHYTFLRSTGHKAVYLSMHLRSITHKGFYPLTKSYPSMPLDYIIACDEGKQFNYKTSVTIRHGRVKLLTEDQNA